ncbi:hypothetical protein GCM10017566_31190 [Amycolatopsis bartoniae]|uniref:Uncharacterized protein n=1 Tax=Amycolatopsis bartoniae TaxID=941986 RepID=A0A8H9IS34_9PSEU|nr:hypothetical protein GCM10017566_31190 [Amycolatopsis bartoniae]
MARLAAFLAWSSQAPNRVAVDRAVAVVKRVLGEHGYETYDWFERQSLKNVHDKVGDEITDSDLVVLDGTTHRANLAYEAGFAHALRLPLIVVKQNGSERLPENFGEPNFLVYPPEADDEEGFTSFANRFDALLTELAGSTLGAGQRAARRSRNALGDRLSRLIDGYPTEHAGLHLISGWAATLAGQLDSGGAAQFGVDADYYQHSFASLRGWEGGRIRAIADLTDETEQFWTRRHPEEMTFNVSERIFLVDWTWFFEDEDRLEQQIELWERHKARHAEGYDIYVATKEDLGPGEVHPLGQTAVGHHLLLAEPDVVGGYQVHPARADGRRLVIERDPHRYGSAAEFYDGVLNRSSRFEPGMTAADLRREWLARTGTGRWDPEWSTNGFPRGYFEHYDRHIRCWIPHYAELVQDCATAVFREVLRTYRARMRPVELLELGFWAGRLTREVVPWAVHLNRPFYDLEQEGPIRRYRAIERTEQSARYVRELLRPEQQTGLDLRLARSTPWEEVEGRYDVVFGALVLHFLIGPEPAVDALDAFFTAAGEHVAAGGALVFTDVFGRENGQAAVELWQEWMVRNGLAKDAVDAYLAANEAMTTAVPVTRLREAATRHGFGTLVRVVGDRDLPFRTVVFRSEE